MSQWVYHICKNRDANEIEEITINQCKGGINYAKPEIVEPFRTFCTSTAVENGEAVRLTVQLSKPIPKNERIEAAKKLRQCVVKAPIMMCDAVLKGIFGSKVVACAVSQKSDSVLCFSFMLKYSIRLQQYAVNQQKINTLLNLGYSRLSNYSQENFIINNV
uniref:Uncharacterized protein n=1 Tax=Spironucleus salmonicida TaxID=348837 RepID=V6LJZ1_9EUKA|eukprot:EST44862.1 hypothetical protein SS50377_15243 [Spironucleus salmonicida]